MMDVISSLHTERPIAAGGSVAGYEIMVAVPARKTHGDHINGTPR